MVQPTCDCAGVSNGTASIDACGVCSGGTTGITPSSPSIWYADTDNDGLGDPDDSVEDCEQPTGYVTNNNDNCPDDATNTCNEPNCTINVSISTTTVTCDATGTATLTLSDYGTRTNIKYKVGTANYTGNVSTASSYTATDLQAGTYTVLATWGNGDCADTEVGTFTITEDCNDVDGDGISTAEDCDDNDPNVGAATTWYADTDNDGVGETSDNITSCTQPTGYVAIAGDNCPEDINKTSPGECGCGVPEEDCTVTGNECNNASPYQSGAVYSEPFTKVIYEGKLYQNKWYTTGNNPDNVNGPWELIGFCTAAPLDCNGKAVWNVNSSYSTPGTEVAHEGSLYANEWYTQGQEPGTNDAWRYLGPCAPQASLMMEATPTLEVYPNPFNNNLTVSIASSIVEVRIQDVLGNELTVNTQSGEQSLTIATHTLPSGTYTLTVVTEAGTYQMSVIKLQ